MYFLVQLIIAISHHRKVRKIFNTAIREENLILGLSTILCTQMYQDWIGRIYGVINPEIENGEFRPGRIQDHNGDTKQWVDRFVVAQINLLRDYIREVNLFDLVTYRIKALKGNNFLVMLEPVTWVVIPSLIKKFLVEVTFEGIILYIIYRILA